MSDNDKKNNRFGVMCNIAIAVILIGFIVLVLLDIMGVADLGLKDRERFDPSPYESRKNNVFQPGINDGLETGSNLEKMPWQESLQVLGLDPEVMEQHKEFIYNSSRISTGASSMPTREYDQDVVNFVGLRRPNYNVPIGPASRVVPTEEADQMPQATRYLL